MVELYAIALHHPFWPGGGGGGRGGAPPPQQPRSGVGFCAK